MTDRTTAIVLAAGQGTRMKSDTPKVLHRLCGQPMVDYVVDAALEAGADDAIVVVGHGREEVEAHLGRRFGRSVRTAVQAHQRGTGHAVQCALPALDDEAASVLLLYGDTPLLRGDDLARLLETRGGAALALLTCRAPDPTGYGRVVRSRGRVTGIVEDGDCDEEQRRIDEINPGMYAVEAGFLRRAIADLDADNAQGELYLTDIVSKAAGAGGVADCAADAATLAGVNDRAQLAEAEEAMYRRIADGWRVKGATIRRGARVDASVEIAPEAVVEHGAVLRGNTRIGVGAHVDVGCVLDDTEVAAGARLLPYSICTSASVGQAAQVGPFSHMRPDSRLDEEARIGNFVEMKKTRLHRGAKANHLAYLGDGEIGEGANVGAGTIFCNYDGFSKHQTTIGQGAFIGSDSQIVAPVTIGEGAYVATGTTVTQDVPAEALAIGRARQTNKEGYATRLKERLSAQKKP